MTLEEKYMAECIKLAKKGAGFVSPNPLVGCVIVKDGRIIGKGYHKRFGEAHAEVNAVQDAKRNGFDVKGSEVYVNLEPCAHTGKTGPCAVMLSEESPSAVYVGMKDPFENVNGKGLKILKQSGVRVYENVLKEKCEELNKFFTTYVTLKRPYVTLKIAQSIDGKIALGNNESKYITSEASRRVVHSMRSKYDAVLIGANTAMHDNPKLDSRLTSGRNPLRVVIDPELRLPHSLSLFTDELKERTIILASAKALKRKKNIPVRAVQVKEVKGIFPAKNILNELYDLNIASLIVEGGRYLFSQFLKSRLYDDLYFFVAPKIIGTGISAFDDLSIRSLSSSKELILKKHKSIGNDILIQYDNVHRHS